MIAVIIAIVLLRQVRFDFGNGSPTQPVHMFVARGQQNVRATGVFLFHRATAGGRSETPHSISSTSKTKLK